MVSEEGGGISFQSSVMGIDCPSFGEADEGIEA